MLKILTSRILAISIFVSVFVVGMDLYAASPDVAYDVSGSMAPFVAGMSKMMHELYAKYPSAKVFLFNDTTRVVTSIDKLKQITIGGGTDYYQMFQKVAKESNAPALVLVSDGAPNNPDTALAGVELLRKKNVKICTVFVGNGPIPQVFRAISDVQIQVMTLSESLKRCVYDLRKKGVIFDTSREVDIEALSKTYSY